MARRPRDTSLETPTARARLAPRGKPYWSAPIGDGLYVGYRRPLKGPGKWVLRRYLGDGAYEATTLDGCADDLEVADGIAVLDFWQACEAVRKAARHAGHASAIALTVAHVVTAYIAERDARETRRQGRPVRSNASSRLARYVIGTPARGKRPAVEPAPLAAVVFAALTEDDLKAWRIGLPAYLKATSAERQANDLKAALHAGIAAHRRVLDVNRLMEVIRYGLKAPQGGEEEASAGVREEQVLSDTQLALVLTAARDVDRDGVGWEGDLFRLVLTLAATGARFSQVIRCTVGDLQVERRRLLVPASRKGRGKSGHVPVPLTDDVVAELAAVTVSRGHGEPLLQRWHVKPMAFAQWERTGRGAWQSSANLTRPWGAIRARAGLSSEVVPYSLRHTSIVRGIKANLPLRLIAASHDTSVRMIEKHYSRWVATDLEEMTRAALRPLVPAVADDGVVVPLGKKKRRK